MASDIALHVDLWFVRKRQRALRWIGTIGGVDVTADDLDLVDLQLLEALIVDEPLVDTRNAAVDVFAAREGHAWPPKVVAQPHWAPIYVRALEGLDELGLAPTVEEGAERVQAFVDRITAS